MLEPRAEKTILTVTRREMMASASANVFPAQFAVSSGGEGPNRAVMFRRVHYGSTGLV